MTNKVRIGLMSGVVAAWLLLAGCQTGPSLVGRWQGQSVVAGGASGQMEVDFKADNTFTSSTTVAQGPISLKIDMTGSYAFKDNKLTLTPADATLKDANATFQNIFNSQKAQILQQAKMTDAPVKFSDNNTVVVTTPQGDTTFTRVTQ